MHALVYCPQSRVIPESIASIRDQKRPDSIVVFDTQDNDPVRHRYENCTIKCERGRQLALACGVDMLLLVDDDMLIPANTLERLDAVHADIVYGLYVRRDGSYQWNAAQRITETEVVPYQNTQAVFGGVFPVAGVGSGCTLIRRRVLEAVTFERRGQHCFDWYLALDAQRLGFTQACHSGLNIGHVDIERGTVLYPSADGYREECYDT